MIIGTGIDIVEVNRIEEKILRDGFRQKIFSRDEIAYCESQVHKGQHYAARFAAKEAFLKAIGEGLLLGHELHEIEVCTTGSGKPFIQLSGVFLQRAKEKGWNRIHVSLSHVNTTACAVVIVEE